MASFKKKFLSSVKWISLLNIGLWLMGFLFSIVLARLIIPESFGRFAFNLALVEGLSLLTGFGINTSILQNRAYPGDDFQNTGFSVSAVLILLYFLISTIVGIIFSGENILIYFIMVTAKSISMLSGVHGILLQKEYKFRQLAVIQTVVFVMSSSIAVLFAFYGYALPALVIRYFLLQVSVSLAIVWLSNFHLSWSKFFIREYVSVFLKNGRELFKSQMVEKILANGDKIIVNYFLGAANLAFLNRALDLGKLFHSKFLSVLQPLFTVSISDMQEDREKASKLFNLAIWLLLRISLVITLVIACSSKELVVILYGDNWRFAGQILPYASLFFVLLPVRIFSRTFLLSNGYFIKLKNVQFFELGLFLVLISIGAHWGGLRGVAMGFSTWMTIASCIYLDAVKKIIPLQIAKIFVLPGILFVVTLSANFLSREFFPISVIPDYLILIITCIVVPFFWGGILLGFERNDLRTVDGIIRG